MVEANPKSGNASSGATLMLNLVEDDQRAEAQRAADAMMQASYRNLIFALRAHLAFPASPEGYRRRTRVSAALPGSTAVSATLQTPISSKSKSDLLFSRASWVFRRLVIEVAPLTDHQSSKPNNCQPNKRVARLPAGLPRTPQERHRHTYCSAARARLQNLTRQKRVCCSA